MAELLPQFLRFAAIGVLGTGAHYLLLVLLVNAGLVVVAASAAGFVLGALVNYALNYRYTFASNKRHHDAMLKFFAVAGVGLLINTALMALFVQVLPVHYLLSQALATILVLFWNFAGNRLWAFKEK